jgi:hypothetical protein
LIILNFEPKGWIRLLFIVVVDEEVNLQILCLHARSKASRVARKNVPALVRHLPLLRKSETIEDDAMMNTHHDE